VTRVSFNKKNNKEKYRNKFLTVLPFSHVFRPVLFSLRHLHLYNIIFDE